MPKISTTEPHGFATPLPSESPKPSDNLTSLVLFRKTPKNLSERDVQTAAEKAFGHAFNQDDQYRVQATPRDGLFIVRIPEMNLGIITASTPYFVDVGSAADKLRDFAAKQAVQEHKAWLSVDLIGKPPSDGPSAAYPFISKLLAQFADENTLAIARTSDSQVVAFQPEFAGFLHHGDLVSVFSAPPKEPMALAKADDPELLAAAVEARRRWPEFVEAFDKRQTLQGFAVKKCFTVEGKSEHMWIEVTKINGTTITGTLDNEPKILTQLKMDDPVTVDVSEIEDWVYSNGKEMVGGFQIKVLTSRPH